MQKAVIYEGLSCAVDVEFIVNGEVVSPDENTEITASLYNFDGTVVPEFEHVVLIPPSLNDAFSPLNSISVPIDSKFTSIPLGKFREYRYLVVYFTFSGSSHFSRKIILIDKMPFYIIEPKDVRAVFGLSSSDLPDEDIDIEGEYTRLLSENPNLEEKFKSGGVDCDKANRLLTLRTALLYANGLELLVVQSEAEGTTKITRFSDVDFKEKIDNVKAEIEDIMVELGESLEAGSVSLFQVVDVGDIFTGA